ncbi:MAG TPA: hypothetical protein VMV36_02595 [Ignavibacteriaceae bacterium]|nr:hypothetical protein [Ignavibacteriaceae bacterium]
MKRIFPARGFAGAFLVILFWTLNWSLLGLRTQWAFFPLWFGFILLVDALVYSAKGSSILSRNRNNFIELFIISIPVWWLFEALNYFTQNWYYEGRQYFSDFQFVLLASLCFSTVMPAVFESAELVATFDWLNKIKISKQIKLDKKYSYSLLILGLVMLFLIILLPHYFYFLIWVSLYLIIEPVNLLLGNKNLFNYLSAGNWKPLLSLIIGVLICAFFWEMWNYFSYPKWVYFLPGVNIIHIFEMPILGYLGYFPFSLELFAIYNLINGSILKTNEQLINFNGTKMVKDK